MDSYLDAVLLEPSPNTQRPVSGEEVWRQLFPRPVVMLRSWLCDPRSTHTLRVYGFSWLLYGVFSTLGFGLILFFDFPRHHAALNSIFFRLYLFVQYIIYMFIPYVYYPSVKDMLVSKDISALLENVIIRNNLVSRFRFKSGILIWGNFAFTTVGCLCYFILADLTWQLTLSSILWYLSIIGPFSVMLGLVMSLLDVHKVQIECFIDKVKSLHAHNRCLILRDGNTLPDPHSIDPSLNKESFKLNQQSETVVSEGDDHISNSSIDLPGISQPDDNSSLIIIEVMREYYAVHHVCTETSDKRGKFIFSLFFIPLSLIVTSVWSLYSIFYTLIPLIGLMAVALTHLIEIGIMMSLINESGHLVSRYLCSYLMLAVTNSSVGLGGSSIRSQQKSEKFSGELVNHISAFIACADHAKPEISFFGSVVLRSRILFAFVGSILTVFIPGVITYVEN